jgi:hypothetical protein
MSPSPPWLERACGGLALLIMLVLLALTIGSPADAAPAPIIIVPTPALDTGTVLPLPARLQAPARRVPPDTIEAPATSPAREAPAPAAQPAQEAPAPEILVAQPAAPVAATATAAVEQSQLVVEPDGTVRLPGVDDWMKNLPPEPTATPRPTVVSTPIPRGGCAARRGCP